MTATILPLADGFGTADHAGWRRQVDRVLDKTGDLDDEALAARFEKVLVTNTIEGLRIEPLYGPDGQPPSAGWPGQAPFVRGTHALGHRRFGWDVRQPVAVGDDDAEVARRVLEELERGTTQVLLELGAVVETGDDLVDRLDRCLDGTYPDLATLAFDADGREPAVADAVTRLAARRGVDPAQLRLVLGLDPIGTWLRYAGSTDLEADLASAVAWTDRARHDHPMVVPLVADGALLHEAGGGDVEELGGSIALGVHLLRVLDAGGIAIDDACRAVEFRYSATPDQFLTIAKLRAGRRLWQRVAAVAGASPRAQRQRQHAVSSSAAAARYDIWVNLLRSTVGAFGAGVGGADSVTIRPTTTSSCAGRIAHVGPHRSPVAGRDVGPGRIGPRGPSAHVPPRHRHMDGRSFRPSKRPGAPSKAKAAAK